MKANVKSIIGSKKGEITLPSQFKEVLRTDIIKRAFHAQESHKLQPYGSKPRAGLDYSADLSKRRRKYRGTYGSGRSRSPRKVMWSRGSQFGYEGAVAPFTKGGRRTHPPKVEKKIYELINKKERRLAVRSALSATILKSLVEKKHVIEKVDVPLIVESKAEKLDKSKKVFEMLLKLGLKEEMERVKEKRIRAGKGKMRGRKYKKKVGPLIVTSNGCALSRAARNLPGVQVVSVKRLNVSALAPGSHPGRLTIFTEDAIKLLDKEGLFQ
ncbi:MAG: 50S ribosomal protein L4 [Nanoarchaeota archaeon]|nr:50S ribosomal protein L4 [Nanoarchaeota archaeon]